MKRTLPVLAVALAMLSMSLATAIAHSPTIPGENESLENAQLVREPTKSWAIYSKVRMAGEARYFKLELKSGQRLYAGVFLHSDTGFLPRIAAMGPGFVNDSELPSFVEVPPGYGHLVVNGTLKGRDYEPFTPASYFQISNVDITVNRTATYYIAVFEPDRGGDFGIAIGYVESFTAEVWLLMPFSLIKIHLWEGQPLWLILAPLVLTLAVGIIAIVYRGRLRKQWPLSPRFWLGAAVAMLLIGTGAMTALQMGMALVVSENPAGGVVTAMFAAIPLALGVWALRQAASEERGIGARIWMALIGALGLLFWGGLVIGPVLAFAYALLPNIKSGRYHES